MNYNYLYGLTVQGIQPYIFATDTLKEIIGASEIIEQMCTSWFYDFLTVNEFPGIRQLNAAGNIRFLTDETTAKHIFNEYHEVLLGKAPGVPFSQAVVKITKGKEYDGIKELDKKLRAQRNIPLNEKDLGIMVRIKYRITGDFAGLANHKVKDDNKYVDVVTSAKYDNIDAKELTNKTSIEGFTFTYPKEFSEIAKGGKHSWLAVIHIDGNGMGLKIKDILEDYDDKFATLKKFSESISNCTLIAYKAAIQNIIQDEEEINNNQITLPIRPIIIGGDDVTVIIRADLAIEFAKIYLKTFDEETSKNDLTKGMTAAAGIAFVKEKFPFHYSAKLAEDLCVYAKNKSKRNYSCLHFYRVQDSIIENYKEIIKRELTAADGTEFIYGPYRVESANSTSNIDDLLKDIKLLKNGDSPKNGMREWIDVKFNQPQMEKILMKRLKDKSPNIYNDIIENTKAYIDYLTLLAVNTKT